MQMRIMKTEKYDDGYGTRVALMYPYDPDTNQLLKETILKKTFWILKLKDQRYLRKNMRK